MIHRISTPQETDVENGGTYFQRYLVQLCGQVLVSGHVHYFVTPELYVAIAQEFIAGGAELRGLTSV